jgi:hypothetical protein
MAKPTFACEACLKNPHRLFNASFDGNVRCTIDLHEGEEFDNAVLRQLIRAAAATNTGARAIRIQEEVSRQVALTSIGCSPTGILTG